MVQKKEVIDDYRVEKPGGALYFPGKLLSGSGIAPACLYRRFTVLRRGIQAGRRDHPADFHTFPAEKVPLFSQEGVRHSLSVSVTFQPKLGDVVVLAPEGEFLSFILAAERAVAAGDLAAH